MSIFSFFTESKISFNTNKDYLSDELINLNALLTECSDSIENADDACWNILDQARLIQVAADTNLFQETIGSEQLFLILKGRLRVYKDSPEGREVTLYRVEPGQLCVHNLVNGLLYPIMVQTETDVLGLIITRAGFNKALAESNTFRNYVLRTLTERLLRMEDLISSFAFEHLDSRIACWLTQQFENTLEKPLKITHSELAHELGTTREMISRILKDLEHKGCIQLGRGRIYLRSGISLNLISEGTTKPVKLQ